MAAEQALRGVLQFGSHFIPRAQVFLLTPLSFAFTNRKPTILPGLQKDLLKAQEGDKEVRELAKNITMPLLILWGQHDRICDVSGASILHSLVPKSEVAVLEKCGHAISLERPRKCSSLLTHFISHITTPL